MPRPAAGRAGRSYRFSGDHFVVVARAAVETDSPRLTMAIPRKLVPSSPVRNLMRRVIRESHLQAARTHTAWFGPAGGWSVRFQLVKVPQDPEAPVRETPGRSVRAAVRPFARRPTDRRLKLRVRAEIDSLFTRLVSRTPAVNLTPSAAGEGS